MTVNADNPSVEETDWTKVKLERGKTPDDIKQKCFQLCRDYLASNWLNVTIDEIEVKRISGGLTNQLYYCGIDEQKRLSETKVPQEVAIRLYSSKHFGDNERLSDTVIALLVSQNKLGPKIYGLFEGGQIQKYYKVYIFFNILYTYYSLIILNAVIVLKYFNHWNI